MIVKKIISGGQTGADRGGLDAAIALGLEHGGWCPRGRLAEDGRVPEHYSLEEFGTGYLGRTRKNAHFADATLIFTYGKMAGGSKRTAEFARERKKPYLHVNLQKADSVIVGQVVNWLRGLSLVDAAINVAGSRESKSPGICKRVEELLRVALLSLEAGPEQGTFF